MFTVLTYYRFVRLDDAADVRDRLEGVCAAAGVLGTVLLAAEGINVALAGTDAAIDDVLTGLAADPRLTVPNPRRESAARLPFRRLRVRLRPEIVTFGRDVDPAAGGDRVRPEEWDALVTDPDVTVVDVRNGYEIEHGTFEGAIDPGTSTFGEFPDAIGRTLDPARHRRVATFCTGGIRCEKATAWLREAGFERVYQLEGGILDYLAQRRADTGTWRGRCFVFDERIDVDGADADRGNPS